MLTEGQHFGCADQQGVYTCFGRTPEVAEIYRRLQAKLAAIGAPVPVDGLIAPSTVLALHQALLHLQKSVPLSPSLGRMFAAPRVVDMIKTAAATAPEALAYIDHALAVRPGALAGVPPVALAPGFKFPTKFVLWTLGAGAAVGAVAFATHQAGRRAEGVMDGRHFLPPDQDESDDGDGDGDE